MTHREAELLLHALPNVPDTEQEDDNEEADYRKIESKGLVAGVGDLWITTDQGREALIQYIKGE